MSTRHFERALEWEAAGAPIVLENVSVPVPPFMPGVTKITLDRDERLRLRLCAEGTLNDFAELARREEAERAIPAGAFVPETTVRFNAYGASLEIKMHISQAPSQFQLAREGSRFQQTGRPLRVRREWRDKFVFEAHSETPRLEPVGEPAWLSDWYVNGWRDLFCTKLTRRRRVTSFTRTRDLSPAPMAAFPNGSSSWDHIVIDTAPIRFGVCRVPAEHASTVKDFYPVSIDFFDPIPTEETRAAVAEIVSFVLGQRLLRLGSTTFDKTGWALCEEVVNPWGADIRNTCRKPEMPPIPFYCQGQILENVLAALVPKYLALREPLSLSDALATYWVATESLSGIDLPIFASAVETLKNAWLKSTRSKSGGLHLPKEEFDRLAGDLVQAMASRVQNIGASEELARNFAGANRMGLGAQLRAFFEEIGLRVGVLEGKAMQARHRSAHGSIGGELRDLVRAGNAYRTLFDRVFLQLLGYDGPYIDRTTEGFPERPLTEPAGG